VRQGREWRIRNNEERDNIIRKKDIVRFVKARRISWIGHVERMEDNRMPKRVMRESVRHWVWKTLPTRRTLRLPPSFARLLLYVLVY
jgi:hypothetical protein